MAKIFLFHSSYNTGWVSGTFDCHDTWQSRGNNLVDLKQKVVCNFRNGWNIYIKFMWAQLTKFQAWGLQYDESIPAWGIWPHLNHGTITRTGITCKKIHYMRDLVCRWLIVKNAKHFWIVPHVKETVESWLVYLNKISFKYVFKSCFLSETIKRS